MIETYDLDPFEDEILGPDGGYGEVIERVGDEPDDDEPATEKPQTEEEKLAHLKAAAERPGLRGDLARELLAIRADKAQQAEDERRAAAAEGDARDYLSEREQQLADEALVKVTNARDDEAYLAGMVTYYRKLYGADLLVPFPGAEEKVRTAMVGERERLRQVHAVSKSGVSDVPAIRERNDAVRAADGDAGRTYNYAGGLQEAASDAEEYIRRARAKSRGDEFVEGVF